MTDASVARGIAFGLALSVPVWIGLAYLTWWATGVFR